MKFESINRNDMAFPISFHGQVADRTNFELRKLINHNLAMPIEDSYESIKFLVGGFVRWPLGIIWTAED